MTIHSVAMSILRVLPTVLLLAPVARAAPESVCPAGTVLLAGGSYPMGETGDGERRLGTCPVGSHPSGDSPQAVKDLSGNVWEWTAGSDRLEGGVACRVRRGGGWSSGAASRVTATIRFCDPPEQRQTDIGFRCAKSR